MALRRQQAVYGFYLVFLALMILTLYLGRERIAQLPLRTPFLHNTPALVATPATSDSSQTSTKNVTNAVKPSILAKENVTNYVYAILDPDATEPPRLECPRPDAARYEQLKASKGRRRPPPQIKYFFALDLRQSLKILPRLLGSVVEVIRFLGPEQCALSIVEGNSDDGTDEVLCALRSELEKLPTSYFLQSSAINPAEGDRIAKLAQLRNLALEPLVTSGSNAVDATVIFLNDVAACAEDILEILHQRRVLGADMTCAMDWTYVGRDPTFYDVWVARGLGGDSFFDIPADGNWNSAWNLFWNDETAAARLHANQPFQVFSCWNGLVAFAAEPVVQAQGKAGGTVAFRAPQNGECHQGEPQLFCKDLWWNGFGRIAVVPAVNLEYSDERARDIKVLKGYTSALVGGNKDVEGGIEWKAEPPAKVRCMADYANQHWEEWDVGLV